jgi:hypothetical protein
MVPFRRGIRAGPSLPKKCAPEGSENGRNGMAQETYRADRATKPLLQNPTPPEAADAATIHVLELPEPLDMAVE